MRILHIATGFPVSFPGGVTNYVRTLSRSQKLRGHRVEILAGPEQDEQVVEYADAVHQFKGVASAFSLSLNRDNKAKSNALYALISKFDIVHFHMAYGVPASFYATPMSVPYVVSLHDYGYICPRIFMMDKWKQLCTQRELVKCRRCVGMIEQVNFLRAGFGRMKWTLPTVPSDDVLSRASRMDTFLRGAQKLLAVSKRVAEIFEKSVSGITCDVLHIGNESAGEIPKRDTWAPKGKIRCAFIGTLNRDKGADVFLQLARSLPCERFQFSFWGRGEEQFLNALSDLGVACNGAYHPSELASIMRDVDVGLVLPIWNDNGPQVLMEFLNHGIPVLGTNMGGIPDFLAPETGFLFDPAGGVESAVHWLESLDSARLADMHSKITPLKTPHTHCNEVLEIYSNIIGCT